METLMDIESKLYIIEKWHRVKLDETKYDEYVNELPNVINGRYYVTKSGSLYCEHEKDNIIPALKWSTK
jgi:hypothetical protein